MAAAFTVVLLVLIGMALSTLLITASVVVYLASESEVRLPIDWKETRIEDVRHGPSRDWLATYQRVLESLGFQLRVALWGPSVVRPGRALCAWFVRPGCATLGLLLVSPRGRSVTFTTGLGRDRLETTCGAHPLTLRCRELVDRRIRPDLSDPAALLHAHEDRVGAASAEASPTVEELVAEMRDSYQRVLDVDSARGLRKQRGQRSVQTWRGRVATAIRRSRSRLQRLAMEVERN